MTKPANDDIIRASEIGEYAYCARAWWLRRVQGVPSRNVAALRSGQQAHDRHGRSVAAYQTQRRMALLLAALAALALLAAGASLVGGAL
jgi:CRISPR/Cas system-associated exonuclease Cas4 (RecB family)